MHPRVAAMTEVNVAPDHPDVNEPLIRARLTDAETMNPTISGEGRCSNEGAIELTLGMLRGRDCQGVLVDGEGAVTSRGMTPTKGHP